VECLIYFYPFLNCKIRTASLTLGFLFTHHRYVIPAQRYKLFSHGRRRRKCAKGGYSLKSVLRLHEIGADSVTTAATGLKVLDILSVEVTRELFLGLCREHMCEVSS